MCVCVHWYLGTWNSHQYCGFICRGRGIVWGLLGEPLGDDDDGDDDDDDDDVATLGEPLGVELGPALGEELGRALGVVLGEGLGLAPGAALG